MRALVRLVTLAVVLAAVIAPAAAQAAPLAGIGEEHGESFSDPRLRWLGFALARTVVRYDVATADPARLDAWLAAVEQAGLEPHVAFTRSPGQTVPATAAAYADAFDAVRARWPQVTVFSAWNEANHESQPIDKRPDLAAAYHRIVRARCPQCTGPAVDVVDVPNMLDYVRSFRSHAADLAPSVWGIHNYGDVNSGSGSTRNLLSAVPGELWISETGGLVELTRASGEVAYAFDEVRAGRAMRRAIDIATASSRIKRVYLYQFKERPWERWDSALVRYDSSLRPGFDVVADWLRPGQAPPPFVTPAEPGPAPAPQEELPPAGGADDQEPLPEQAEAAIEQAVSRAFEQPLPKGAETVPLAVARVTARAWLVGDRVVVGVRCSAGAAAGCAGAVGVGARYPLPAWLRRPRTVPYRLGPGATGTAIVDIPRVLARRLRQRRSRKVVVSARSADGRVAWIGVLPVARMDVRARSRR